MLSSHRTITKLTLLTASVFMLLVFFAPQPVAAQSYDCICGNTPPAIQTYSDKTSCEDTGPSGCREACLAASQPVFECKPSANAGGGSGGGTQLKNPLGTTSVPEIIGKVVRTALGVVGSLALILFIYGGFMWMTAGGSSERVKKGRDILMWSTIGILVIFSSYAILTFIFSALA